MLLGLPYTVHCLYDTKRLSEGSVKLCRQIHIYDRQVDRQMTKEYDGLRLKSKGVLFMYPSDIRFGGFQPPFAPPGQGPQAGPPTSPPPSFVPQQQVEAYAVDPGGIRRCLFRYTYVWLRGFEQFWFYPTFVGRNSVSGYRWTGFRWVYFGVDLRQIQSFTCF